jgi:hypothetical protein
MNLADILWVGLAGTLGAVARFSVDGAMRSRATTTLPIGTLTINLTGSLLLGILTGLITFHAAPSTLTLVAGTGFCGGYTTSPPPASKLSASPNKRGPTAPPCTPPSPSSGASPPQPSAWLSPPSDSPNDQRHQRVLEAGFALSSVITCQRHAHLNRVRHNPISLWYR